MKDHYRKDRMWTEQSLIEAERELSQLRSALKQDQVAPTSSLVQTIVDHLANDLDTTAIIDTINEWVALSHSGSKGGDEPALTSALDALLGIKL
jgi:L-cysteine:1D-myo-inositol 2-amino-2-deoxy-alpha-D-glucopyranoside ligase